MLHILIGIAALLGCAGVMLMAAGAHAKPGAGLDSAAHMLLFHAPAVIAVCAAIGGGLLHRKLALLACVVLLVGASLFAGDLVLRAFAGQRLFPMAAPTGGMTTMAGWVLLALAAFLAMR